MTVSTLALAAAPPRSPLGDLLAERPIDPGSALGRLFAPAQELAGELALARWVAEAPRRVLGELDPPPGLLPAIERERAAILLAWLEALAGTGEEADAPERRLARLNRSAFLLARALAGEPAPAPFVRAFAAESARRPFGRPALDALLALARERVLAPRPATPAAWAARAAARGGALAAALIGAEPSPATIEATAGIVRILALRALPAGLARGRVELPASELAEPLQYRKEDEIAAAVAAECDAVRPLLLRGARAVGEVPLTYRRPLAYLLTLALDLLGRIEVHPEALARTPIHLGWWTRRTAAWRLRHTPLA